MSEEIGRARATNSVVGELFWLCRLLGSKRTVRQVSGWPYSGGPTVVQVLVEIEGEEVGILEEIEEERLERPRECAADVFRSVVAHWLAINGVGERARPRLVPEILQRLRDEVADCETAQVDDPERYDGPFEDGFIQGLWAAIHIVDDCLEEMGKGSPEAVAGPSGGGGG